MKAFSKMTKKSVLIFCLLLGIASASSKTEGNYRTHWGKRKVPINPHSPKTYEINLDLPFEERYRQVMTDFKPAVDKLLSHLWLKHLPLGVFDYFTYPIAQRYNAEFTEHIQAFAKIADVSFTKIFLLNFLFDFAAACSSVLVQGNDDKVIHAYGLDFGITPYVASLIYHGKYYRGEEFLFETIEAAGYTGVLAGHKPNGYTFSINEFFEESSLKIHSHIGLAISYVKRAFTGKISPPFVVRKAFEQARDFESFVKTLCETETISRVHYAVGGPKKGQGVVISKFQDEVHALTKLDPENGKWFIAQTNYKQDIDDPKTDNRRTAEIDRLEAIGRDAISVDKLFSEIMNLYPTFNAHTVQTTLMKPSEGYFNATVWW